MAINLRCPVCKREFSLKQTERCRCAAGFKFKVVIRTPAGKKVTKQVDTLVLAKKVEAKFRTSKIEEEVFGLRPAAITLAEAWAKFLAWATTHKRSWKDDQSRWTYHVEPHLAGKRIDRVTPTDIQALLDRMTDHAPATRKQVLALVKRIINWSTKAGLYEGPNPCNRVETPRFCNTVTNPLTKEALARLLAGLEAFGNDHFRLVVLYALYSGKRRGEILKLSWADVDLENRLATYRNTKGGTTQALPLNESCLKVLTEARRLASGSPLVPRKLCFPSSAGAFYHSFDATWQRFRRRYGLEGYRFHDLRHTFASYLASSGKVDIYTLKELLGHKDLTTTSRYAHLINGALQRGAAVADVCFESSNGDEVLKG